MKIVTKDNFDRDLFIETVIAEQVHELIGKEMVKAWNDLYWTEQSDYFLVLVEDNYEPYDGYKKYLEEPYSSNPKGMRA